MLSWDGGASGRAIPLASGPVPPAKVQTVPGPAVIPAVDTLDTDPVDGLPTFYPGYAVSSDLFAGEWIAYKVGEAEFAQAPAALLDDFVGLADARDAAVVRFVKKYGPLELCRHLRPSGHNCCGRMGTAHPASDAAEPDPTGPVGLPDGFDYWEPIEAIRHYARQFLGVARVSDSLLAQERPRQEDWADAHGGFERIPASISGQLKVALRDDKQFMLNQIDLIFLALMGFGTLRHGLLWDSLDVPPQQVLDGNTYDVLSYQLAAVVATGNVPVCTYEPCRKPIFDRKRRTQAGRDAYCDAHREKRQAIYKRRKRAENTTPKKRGTGRRLVRG